MKLDAAGHGPRPLKIGEAS
jgi:hypothetical protein